MQIVLEVVIVAFRLLLPLIVLFNPFFAIASTVFLDMIDGDLLTKLGISYATYQLIDKFFDYYLYTFILVIAARWKIRNTLIFFFIYRSLGHIFFFLTQNDVFFFIFQNYFVFPALIYSFLLFRYKTEERAYLIYKKHFSFIWISVFVFQFWNEWYLHIAHIDLTQTLLGY